MIGKAAGKATEHVFSFHFQDRSPLVAQGPVQGPNGRADRADHAAGSLWTRGSRASVEYTRSQALRFCRRRLCASGSCAAFARLHACPPGSLTQHAKAKALVAAGLDRECREVLDVRDHVVVLLIIP